MRLEGKRAVVTGAARGFGRAIAELFAQEGAKVGVLDVNGDGAREAAGAIGGSALALEADVTDGAALKAAVDEAADAFGGLDTVVNNAGWTHVNQPMLEVDEPTFQKVFDVNVKSIFLMAHAALPHLRAAGGGVVVNIGSTAGIRPRPGLTWYNASKGAVNMMSKSMAVELAPEGIRVCALAPVAGETPLLGRFLGEDTPEKRAAFLATIPMGRMSQPIDVARAALHLASDDADFLTGVVLEVDGGRCV